MTTDAEFVSEWAGQSIERAGEQGDQLLPGVAFEETERAGGVGDAYGSCDEMMEMGGARVQDGRRPQVLQLQQRQQQWNSPEMLVFGDAGVAGVGAELLQPQQPQQRAVSKKSNSGIGDAVAFEGAVPIVFTPGTSGR